MKKFAAVIMLLCLVLCGCSTDALPQSDKLQIVCATFPAYDFAREIAGNKAEITLLIKPGAEVHSYEPTPKDVVRIQESDLFICNGGESEEWLEELLCDGMNVVYMMNCVDAVAEEEKEGMYVRGETEGEVELDEHVWTSPVNAALISGEICERLCELDPDNAALYTANCQAYTAQLTALDAEFRRVVDNAPHKTLVFADRFPMRHFTREYGLEYLPLSRAVLLKQNPRQKPLHS